MAVVTTPNDTNDSSTDFPDGMAKAITPNDADTFASPVRVYVGGAGNVAVRPWNSGASGAAVTFTAPAVGSMLPVRVIAVLATGTTATNLVACY